MSSILVTGAAGFIGSHLAERLLDEGHMVIALDNLDGYYSRDIKEGNIKEAESNAGYTFIEASILDSESTARILDEHSVEYVIHEAAQAGVRASMENPVKTLEVNAIGTLRLLEAIGKSSVRKLVFASSSSVYGRIKYLPFDEEHPKNPISPYGMSKLMCEGYISLYGQTYGLENTCLRYFTVYGPRIRPDLAIHKFTVKALRNEPIEVYGDGSKTRDFTFVEDAVDATVKAISRGDGAYNIGGGTRVSVKRLAEMILEYTGGKSRIEYSESVKGDVEHTMSDTSKAREELRWVPNTGLEEGLKMTVEWIRAGLDHPNH
ncbi:MAG: GDP-mannose 4,6-dehydratase [Candidatus Altiarchaeota archaeon]